MSRAAARARLITGRPKIQRVRAYSTVRARQLRQPRVVRARHARRTAFAIMPEAHVALAKVFRHARDDGRGVPGTIQTRPDRRRVGLRRVRVGSTGGAQRGADGVFVFSELARGTANTGQSENLPFD